jgi:hypothetical protein
VQKHTDFAPKIFEESIEGLETKSRANDSIAPYFAAELEGLSEHYDMVDNLADMMDSASLQEFSLVKPLMSLFANRPTRLIREDRPAKFSPAHTMLSLFDYVGIHRNSSDFLMALKGTISTSMFRKL